MQPLRQDVWLSRNWWTTKKIKRLSLLSCWFYSFSIEGLSFEADGTFYENPTQIFELAEDATLALYSCV